MVWFYGLGLRVGFETVDLEGGGGGDKRLTHMGFPEGVLPQPKAPDHISGCSPLCLGILVLPIITPIKDCLYEGEHANMKGVCKGSPCKGPY